MKIHKTQPEESKLWQTDAPGIRAMRVIMPIAALLSAVSLAGGIASFFEVGLTTIIGICLIVAFAVAAWHFDALAVSSGQSVVRELILAFIRKEIEVDVLFWFNLVFATLICGGMVFGSFQMSRNGISYLVLEVRKAKEIRTATDTTLTNTIAGASDQNAEILEAKKVAHEAQVAAVNATYTGKVEALEAEIQRRKKQRSSENYQYIDQRIAKLKMQIGEVKAEQGQELAGLAGAFAEEQARILAGNEQLQSIIIEDAKSAADRRKTQQEEKDAADRALSGLVAAIFSWSVILMLIIGLRLAMLETRNGILPNPILSNFDLSGSAMPIRFLLAIPNFVLSCLHWIGEWLYRVAPKRPTPTVDNDLVDFKAAQGKVVAIRKEGKTRAAPASVGRREIGFGRQQATANSDGKHGGQMTAKNTGANDGYNGPVSTAPENGQISPENQPEKEIVYREVDTALRDCIECGQTYRAKAHNQKFCGRNCKVAHHTRKNDGRAFDPAKYHGKKF